MGTGEWIGVAGALVTLLTGVFVFVVYRWQKDLRILDYSIVVNQPIISDNLGGVRSSLRISFAETVLEEPRLVTVRIKNVGRKAIQAEDYTTPITINYEKNPPLMATVVSESSEDIVDVISGEAAGFNTRPDLLNRGDWFDIQLLSDGDPGTVTVKSRLSTNPPHAKRSRRQPA